MGRVYTVTIGCA